MAIYFHNFSNKTEWSYNSYMLEQSDIQLQINYVNNNAAFSFRAAFNLYWVYKQNQYVSNILKH